MENASIYLFPFIIEYSIIGSSVIYNMWKSIGRRAIKDSVTAQRAELLYRRGG